ncbi:hypothetical protein SASPL_101042 [Salvia splendens]|uniref:Uncharacterized protein n=1 Tax=Salvia splendens TaxID=180675 RepID=A0A8X8YV35_SALSN|nr:hypothetical protein SASPL_101042 [Salvia splendens]
MAAPKSYFPRANYRFLPTFRETTNNSMIFELDESEEGEAIGDRVCFLKDEYRGNRRRDSDEEEFDVAAENGDRVPPHEFVARSRIASSVQEGLKGRDLNRVRNAI